MTGEQNDRRLFAVIPAGGLSRRMGRPKLLLPLGGQTVIRGVLDVLSGAGIADVYLLIRDEDADLRSEVSQTDATAVMTPAATRDMRNSVDLLLQAIERDHHPDIADGWLLCPADHPVLDVGVVRQLVQSWRQSQQGIVVPIHKGRRGHPTIFAWRYARMVQGIPADHGIKWLLEAYPDDVHEEPVNSAGVLTDLDTPIDYEILRQSLDEDLRL